MFSKFVFQMVLVTGLTYVAQQVNTPPPPPPIVEEMTQEAEYVFDVSCVESLTPGQNFKVHIPMLLDGKGTPDTKRIAFSGDVGFVIKKGCTPRISTVRKPKTLKD